MSNEREIWVVIDDLNVQVGEEVFAKVTAMQVSGTHVKFETVCHAVHGKIIIDGIALAKLN